MDAGTPGRIYPGYTSRMRCNIDSKGKAVRLVGGLATVLIALVFAGLAGTQTAGVWAWYVAAGCGIGGAFQIFESWSGWCVLRAMGLRTPI